MKACNYTVPCPAGILKRCQVSVEVPVRTGSTPTDHCHVYWQNSLFSKDHIKTALLGLTAGHGTLFISNILSLLTPFMLGLFV